MRQGSPQRSGLHVSLTHFVSCKDGVRGRRHPGVGRETGTWAQTHLKIRERRSIKRHNLSRWGTLDSASILWRHTPIPPNPLWLQPILIPLTGLFFVLFPRKLVRTWGMMIQHSLLVSSGRSFHYDFDRWMAGDGMYLWRDFQKSWFFFSDKHQRLDKNWFKRGHWPWIFWSWPFVIAFKSNKIIYNERTNRPSHLCPSRPI